MSKIIKVKTKPDKCPICGGKIIPIEYGFPTNEAFEMAERGEIKLGGCCICEDNPEWACRDCDAEFVVIEDK